MTQSSLQATLGQLEGSPPAATWKPLLAQAKVQLAQRGLLVPSTSSSTASTSTSAASSSQDLVAAREILSRGAILSLQDKDVTAFVRYVQQVKPFWEPSLGLTPSPLQHPLTGLSLLRLLANNDIAGFHTLLEELASRTSLDDLHSNAYIKYPLDLERWLMEGAYSKVWSARAAAPMPEYQLFLDQLVQTVRNEIASCSEKAYASLPLSDAAVLLFFQNRQDLLAFASARPGWNVNPTSGVIEFTGAEGGIHDELAKQELPKERLVETILGYAKELETIV